MANQLFNQVQFQKPRRNVFNLSHDRKFSMNMGDLVPIMCEELVPGDKFKIKSEALIKMAPMLAPVMHRINIFTHFFFVPHRLVWDEWEDFITGGPTGTSNPVSPYVLFGPAYGQWVKNGSLLDYFGGATSETAPTAGAKVSALPFRAYSLIYNDYYRDQDLESEVVISKESGNASSNTDVLELRKRPWEKDCFTSARPFTQKGGEVEIPLIGDAPIVLANNTLSPKIIGAVSKSNLTLGDVVTDSTGDLDVGGVNAQLDPNGTLLADISAVTSATIAELRNAVRLQEWLEKNARGGSRYIEQMLSHFGVRSSDARLQRPEYLGGSKTPMLISEVLQTSESATSPQGNQAGHGVSAGSSPNIEMYAEEHGYIIGIMSVLPKTSYQQGFRRHLLKTDKFDYFWPSFEHIGEQEIYNAELYHDFTAEPDKTAFGYQSRYYEYKDIPCSVHGDFKDPLQLGYWHMGRIFDSKPALNSNFIKSDPTTRVFAVTGDEHKLWCMVYNDVMAIRPMSRFSNPKL